jgi:hypothetical protein
VYDRTVLHHLPTRLARTAVPPRPPDGVSPASMAERHPSTQITHRKQLHDADVLVNSTSVTYRDLGHGRSLPTETRDPRRPWSCGEQSRAPPPLISLIEVTSKLQATQGGVQVGCRGQGDDKSHGSRRRHPPFSLLPIFPARVYSLWSAPGGSRFVNGSQEFIEDWE